MDKQTDKQINNFALKVAKQLPYDLPVIISSLTELLDENVLYVEGDYLCQKRMISDNELSIKRSEAGSKGGKNNIKNNKEYKNFAKAKMQANTEYEYENENEDEIVVLKGGVGEKWNTKPGQEYMDLELDKTKGGAVVQLFSFSKNHSLTEIELQLLWGIFKAQNFNGEKYYGSKNEVFSHFINWSKTQNVENAKSITTGGKPKNGSSYKTAGQDAYAERLKRQLSELVPR